MGSYSNAIVSRKAALMVSMFLLIEFSSHFLLMPKGVQFGFLTKMEQHIFSGVYSDTPMIPKPSGVLATNACGDTSMILRVNGALSLVVFECLW